MLKVKDTVVQRFYRTNLTNIEQLVFKSLIAMSNEAGMIKDNYYKEVIEDVGCSTAQYYRTIISLEQKNLIQRIKNTKDIIIIDNDFSSDKGKFKNYCDMNKEAFSNKNYKKLKAGARRILEYFIFRVEKRKANADKENKLVYKFQNKSLLHLYSLIKKEIFGNNITIRMFIQYIEELKKLKFISIAEKLDINNKNYDVITVLAGVLIAPNIEVVQGGKNTLKKRNSMLQHYLHNTKTLLRKYKVSSDIINIYNVADLFIQYRKKAMTMGKNIYSIIKTAICTYVNEIDTKLDSRILHSLIKKILHKDYNTSFIMYR